MGLNRRQAELLILTISGERLKSSAQLGDCGAADEVVAGVQSEMPGALRDGGGQGTVVTVVGFPELQVPRFEIDQDAS